MQLLAIVLICMLVIAVFALMKAASDADDHAETLRDSKEEK